MRRALLFLLPALAACSMNSSSDAGSGGSDTPASGQTSAQPAVEVKQRAADGSARGATGGRGVVTVRGSLSAPSPCHVISGAAAREGTALTLTLSVRPGAEACIATIGELGYDATIRGLPAGRYTLRVVHTYPDTGWSTETALTQAVDVA